MQQSSTWQVIVEGIDRDVAETSAIDALQKTFKLPEDKARQLLDGHARIIKKDLTLEVANKYVAALSRMGVNARSEEIPRPVLAMEKNSIFDGLSLVPQDESAVSRANVGQASSRNSPEEKQGVTLDAGQMLCPKCGRQQQHALECAHCGIIIARYQQILDARENSDAGLESDRASFMSTRFGRAVIAMGLVVALFSAYRMQHDGQYLSVGKDNHALAQINALNEAATHPVPDMKNLKSLIDSGRYTDAEQIIRELQEKSLSDISWEEAYKTTIDGISHKNNFDVASLDKWVEDSHSAISYLARGSYYMAQGNKVRGTKYASETSAAQFSAQAELYKHGIHDLQKAIRLNRALFPAYTLLLMADGASGIEMTAPQLLQEAISVAPGSYFVRYQFLRTLMPKWGGSYEEMDAYTATVDNDVHLNPRVWLLKGFAADEKCHTAMHERAWDQCVSFCSEALQYGIHSEWLTHRASCLSELGKNTLALEDVNLALQYTDSDYTKKMKAYIESQ